MKKNAKDKAEFRIEKVIKKATKSMLNGKVTKIHLIVRLIRKIYYEISCLKDESMFSQSHECFRGNAIAELDLIMQEKLV